jgi:UDP-GlcNAc3NAcA epimerase
MSDIFFEEMCIVKPNYHLAYGGGRHGEMTGKLIVEIERLLIEEDPDFLLIYGDTNSTLAAAIAAAKMSIPIAHVEAGLRSYNKKMPEEINRVLTDHVSTLHLVPTEAALQNLRHEGFKLESSSIVGDVMYDACLHFLPYAKCPDVLINLDFEFILCTVHRQENTEDLVRLTALFDTLADLGKKIILPLHPRTRIIVDKSGYSFANNILVIPPVGYLEMLWLESNCMLVMTDSGGVQKEAYFNNKRCITLREETEWVELVEQGYNKLTGINPLRIREAYSEISQNKQLNTTRGIYGDGKASAKIVDRILDHHWNKKCI